MKSLLDLRCQRPGCGDTLVKHAGAHESGFMTPEEPQPCLERGCECTDFIYVEESGHA